MLPQVVATLRYQWKGQRRVQAPARKGGGLLFILALQYGENRLAAIMGAVGLLSDADLRDATESWE